MWAIERAIALGATDAEEAIEIAGKLAAYVEEGVEDDAAVDPVGMSGWLRKAVSDLPKHRRILDDEDDMERAIPLGATEERRRVLDDEDDAPEVDLMGSMSRRVRKGKY